MSQMADHQQQTRLTADITSNLNCQSARAAKNSDARQQKFVHSRHFRMNRDETSDRKRSGPRKNEMPDQGMKKKDERCGTIDRGETRPDLLCMSVRYSLSHPDCSDPYHIPRAILAQYISVGGPDRTTCER
jgi:hypothetical protein